MRGVTQDAMEARDFARRPLKEKPGAKAGLALFRQRVGATAPLLADQYFATTGAAAPQLK